MAEETAKRKNPFVGPRPFTRADILHGRDRETDALFNLLISGRILLMYAPSGAGKTSLIQAALIPRMIEEGFSVLDNLRVNSEPEPGLKGAQAPNRYLSSVLGLLEDARLGVEDGDGGEGLAETQLNEGLVETQLNEGLAETQLNEGLAMAQPNEGLAETQLNEGLAMAQPNEGQVSGDPGKRLSGAELSEMGLDGYLSRYHPQSPTLLVFDQFEEILTLNPVDIEAKRAFFEEVGRALGNPTRWALFSMREDYRSALDPYLEPLPTRLKTTFRLDLLTREVAIDVIRKTAGQAEVDFQQPAAQRLVDDLGRVQVMRLDGTMEEQVGPFVEPVQLQVVCYDLFERLAPGDPDITEDEIKEIGDVDQALARYYAGKVQTIAQEADPDQISPELAARQARRRVRRSRQGKKIRTPAKNELAEMVIRNWFDRELITPGGVRNQLLMGAGSSKGLDNQMIDRLENAHLVRKDNRGGRTWIELAHDRLVGPVRQDNQAWFRAKSRGSLRKAVPWLAGGALALALTLIPVISGGLRTFLITGGASILLFTLVYLLTTQRTRRLAMEERNLWIYKGSRTLGEILGVADLIALWLVLLELHVGVVTFLPIVGLALVLLLIGLSLIGVAVGFSGAKELSRTLTRLRVPYELGFFVGFVVISLALSFVSTLVMIGLTAL